MQEKETFQKLIDKFRKDLEKNENKNANSQNN